MSRLAAGVFAALVIATFGAFFVAQRLKNAPSIVQQFTRTPFFSPNHDGRYDRAYVSFKLKRADDVTVAVVAARIGLEPVEDARFAETDTGEWTDRSFADVRAEDPEGFARFARSDPSFRYPGGESFGEQSARVMAGLRDLWARPRELPALVVCHRGVIRLALAVLLGDEGEGAKEIANASLVTLPEPAAGT